jgi:hypothetical protein
VDAVVPSLYLGHLAVALFSFPARSKPQHSSGSSGPGPGLLTSSNSGAGCSTVSTAGATGSLVRRAAFFTGARLGFAVRFAVFAILDTLRGLPRLAELPLRSLARFCTFDPFLRLAMIAPLF